MQCRIFAVNRRQCVMGCVKTTHSLRAGVMAKEALRRTHATYGLETHMRVLEVSSPSGSSSSLPSPLRQSWSLNDGPLPPLPDIPRTLSDEQLADILASFTSEMEDDGWVPANDWTALETEEDDDDVTMTEAYTVL